MKLVAAAAAFLLGAAAALGFDLVPGLNIPAAAFSLLLAASIIGVSGALLAGRRLGIGLLVLIALLGMWRGGHAAAADIRDAWHGVPESFRRHHDRRGVADRSRVCQLQHAPPA